MLIKKIKAQLYKLSDGHLVGLKIMQEKNSMVLKIRHMPNDNLDRVVKSLD